MPLKHNALESQLERAKAQLSLVESNLGEQIPKKNVDWRKATARVRQIEGRITSRTAVASVKADSTEESAE